MVAVLLRLRFRVLGNTLRRNTFQLIAVIAGAVSALALLTMAFGLMTVVSNAPTTAAQSAVVVLGSTLVFGWLIVPLLFDGVDRTLDPVKLARFPVRAGQLMTAMFVVGLAWVPGIATLVASIMMAIAWIGHPASAAIAIVAGLLGTATCIIVSRLSTSLAAVLLRGRGALRIGIAAVVVLAVAVPLGATAMSDTTLATGDLLKGFARVVDVLGWTPLGAVWAVPGRLAMGDTAGALGAAAIGVGALVGLIVLWRVVIGVGMQVRGENSGRSVKAGRLGALGWLPSTPTGAVAARSLIYWVRDARLARQLILIPVLPALMLLASRVLHVDGIAIAIGPIVASLLPLSVFAGLSYDGTAFAAEIAAGVRGLHDRLGRAIALLSIALPAGVIVQVIVAVVIDRVDELPAMLGLSIGTLLVSIGVVSVSSARIVVPVARAGRNPFSAQPGSATVSIVGSYAVSGVTSALVVPVVALAVVALVVHSSVLSWLALLVGLVIGAVVAIAGVVLGGRMLDSSGPALLARLRLIRD